MTDDKCSAPDQEDRFIERPLRHDDGTPFSPEEAAILRREIEIRIAQRKKEQEERRLKREQEVNRRNSSKQDEQPLS
ncbi:MAG TPA: hypothetical protein PLQ56_23345 [Aggregatilineales bacterium]|nr:hypothetical protein [Aggregatilineales bacterium]